jgi:hypothetical protein
MEQVKLQLGDRYEKDEIEFPCLFAPIELFSDKPNFAKAFLTECKIRGAGYYYPIFINVTNKTND